MSNASRDENNVPTMIGVWRGDGKTPQIVTAEPNFRAIYISDGVGGVNNGGLEAGRDGNMVPTLLAVSSTDGVTPVPLYVTLDGRLLINSGPV